MKEATLRKQMRASAKRWNAVQHKPTNKIQARELVVYCPRATKNDGVIEAIYALYYLPQNYTLVVNTNGIQDAETADKIQALSCQESIMDRIALRNEKAGSSDETSPFLFADIVLYGANPTPVKSASNPIVVFDLASANANKTSDHNVTVAEKDPESIASAILGITQSHKQ